MDETEITVRFFCTCQSSQTRGYEHKIPSAEHAVNCQVSIQSFHMRDVHAGLSAGQSGSDYLESGDE